MALLRLMAGEEHASPVTAPNVQPILCWSCSQPTWPAPDDLGTTLCAPCALQDPQLTTFLAYVRALDVAHNEHTEGR